MLNIPKVLLALPVTLHVDRAFDLQVEDPWVHCVSILSDKLPLLEGPTKVPFAKQVANDPPHIPSIALGLRGQFGTDVKVAQGIGSTKTISLIPRDRIETERDTIDVCQTPCCRILEELIAQATGEPYSHYGRFIGLPPQPHPFLLNRTDSVLAKRMSD